MLCFIYVVTYVVMYTFCILHVVMLYMCCYMYYKMRIYVFIIIWRIL